MANHGIRESQSLLKRLNEEMIFLNSIMSQIENLSTQAQYVSSGIKKTWSDIYQIHKDCKQNTENS